MQMKSLQAKLLPVLGVVLLLGVAIWLRHVGVHEAEIVLGAVGVGVAAASFLGAREKEDDR